MRHYDTDDSDIPDVDPFFSSPQPRPPLIRTTPTDPPRQVTPVLQPAPLPLPAPATATEASNTGSPNTEPAKGAKTPRGRPRRTTAKNITRTNPEEPTTTSPARPWSLAKLRGELRARDIAFTPKDTKITLYHRLIEAKHRELADEPATTAPNTTTTTIGNTAAAASTPPGRQLTSGSAARRSRSPLRRSKSPRRRTSSERRTSPRHRRYLSPGRREARRTPPIHHRPPLRRGSPDYHRRAPAHHYDSPRQREHRHTPTESSRRSRDRSYTRERHGCRSSAPPHRTGGPAHAQWQTSDSRRSQTVNTSAPPTREVHTRIHAHTHPYTHTPARRRACTDANCAEYTHPTQHAYINPAYIHKSRYNFSTAPPPARTGMADPSPVLPTTRHHILAGLYVDLATLLLPSTIEQPRELLTEMGPITLKAPRPGRTKDLTPAEFAFAFGIYRDTLCDQFPNRREELDQYMHLVLDMALTYGGNGFYTYHVQFASRAAAILDQRNQAVYWGERDNTLFCQVFASRPPIPCTSCGAPAHPASTCVLNIGAGVTTEPAASPATPIPSRALLPTPAGTARPFLTLRGQDKKGRQVFAMGEATVCNDFNSGRCSRSSCRFLHICTCCTGAHSKEVCPQKPT